jgi:hypothetical protein
MRSINFAALLVAATLFGLVAGIFSAGCSAARFDVDNIEKELAVTYYNDTACISVRAVDTVNHVTLGPWRFCTPIDSLLVNLHLIRVRAAVPPDMSIAVDTTAEW